MSSPISPLDLSFLLSETRNAPQHVSGVMVFHNPGAPAADWTLASLVQRYRAAKPVAPFNVIPEFPLLGRPRWKQVRDFDMRYHVQHVALPSPGSDAQLDELVQQWHSELLDRQRPLFHLTFVEGLEGNRFAIFARIHHSIVDGALAIRRLLGSLSDDPSAPPLAPLFAAEVSSGPRRTAPVGIASYLSSSASLLKRKAIAAGELSGEFWSKVSSRAAGQRSQGSSPFEAPMTPINVPVQYGRAFAHLSLPSAPLIAAAKSLDGTLNDAVLAMIDDAVARYLEQHGHALSQPLHALVPVSLRDANSSESGTKVSGVVCPLGDPGADVWTRLQQTIERMNAAKAKIRGFSKTAAMDYFVGLYFVAQGLGVAGIRRPIANYTVSNVPGSRVQMYLGGAPLLGVYPMNVLAVGLGLSVTLVSRADQLDFGFTSNRTALPDPGEIATLCRNSFAALERGRAAARRTTRRNKTSGPKARSARNRGAVASPTPARVARKKGRRG